MSSSGLSRIDGSPIGGWEHTWQSILDILTTPIGSRVMRRDYGSLVPELIDRPGTQERIADVTIAVAEALDLWEPRFAVYRISIEDAGQDGAFDLHLFGRYFPRGHLGDFSVYEDDRSATIRVDA